MLHMGFTTPTPTPLSIPDVPYTQSINNIVKVYSDSRTHGYSGPSRYVSLPGASSGGGAISKSQDGERCVVAGRESLRILRISESAEKPASDHKFAIGRGGHRIDASRNMWSGSGLKVDSALTDVAWGHNNFDSKILTSARNGELMMWDLNRSGSSKFERKVKDHLRAINKLSYSTVIPHFCCTGSSDGGIRLWDLRNFTKSVIYVHHTSAVRTVLLSPSVRDYLHVISGGDNGTLYRWDLRMGQKGNLDKAPLAHIGPIMSLDWVNPVGAEGGWLASAGLDQRVKIWSLSSGGDANATSTSAAGGLPRKPQYTLHTSFPVRRVVWRPGYETELAIASYREFGFNMPSHPTSGTLMAPPHPPKDAPELSVSGISGMSSPLTGSPTTSDGHTTSSRDSDVTTITGRTLNAPADMIEIWDVRRAWLAKWTLKGSGIEGGVTDMTFADSHALWVQHPSGAFSQMDLRHSNRPIDSMPRSALTWNATGSLTFVTDRPHRWEVPYDDVSPTRKIAHDAEMADSHKKLGDGPEVPSTQALGTCAQVHVPNEWFVLARLASSYLVKGESRSALCEHNAEVAFDADQNETGRTWLLLQSLLADVIESKPPTLPASPKHSNSRLSHSVTALEATSQRSAQNGAPHSTSSDPPRGKLQQASPSRGNGADRSTEALSIGGTSLKSPVSPIMSPVHSSHDAMVGAGLGETSTPNLRSRRQASVSILPTSARTNRTSVRRASLSTSLRQFDNPESGKSPNLRHVGEGALDDSDSSEDNIGTSSTGKSNNDVFQKDAEKLPVPLSPVYAKRNIASPLSGEDNTCAENEQEEETVSPGSSETDSDDSVASTKPRRSSSVRHKSRSRSSTFASLSAPTHLKLVKQDSASSIRTVTAGETPVTNGTHLSHSLRQESHSSDRAVGRSVDRSSLSQKTSNRRSQVFSVNTVVARLPNFEEGSSSDDVDENEQRFLRWNRKPIQDAEEAYRQIGWTSLRDALEIFVRTGDVQMCAMLACIAPKELGIPMWRVTQFVEAYVDILLRLRLHGAAAHMRKYSPSLDLQAVTQQHTTLLTNCGRCRKPIMQARIRVVNGSHQPDYGFCGRCKQATVMCTICHLPVHASLFVCAVCSHGGHQDCYRRYYMERPMTELYLSTEARGRSLSRTSSMAGSENGRAGSETAALPINGSKVTVKVMGHPCASGCGHYCWTASEKVDTG